MSGFEPLTVRLQGASGPSPGVAGRGSICRLAAVIVAGDSLTSPGSCLRWLPVWLPDPDDAASRGKKGVARRTAPRALAVAAPVGSELSDTRITDRDGRAEARRAISAVISSPFLGVFAVTTEGFSLRRRRVI